MNAEQPWGSFAPPPSAKTLQTLISLGFSRGKIRRAISKSWQNKFGTKVDTNVRGINYRLDLENNTTDGRILTSSGIYDRDELEALGRYAKNGVFVDVGANIGYYSLSLAVHYNSKVIAIEPNPPTLARLRFNIACNNLEEKINVFPFGIADEGQFELFSTGELGSASMHDDTTQKTKSVTIKTRPLIDIIKDSNTEKIDALKIDIEGMEDRALIPFVQEAPKTLLPKCIVLEHGHEHLWEKDLMGILSQNGYKIILKNRGNTILKLQ